MRFPILNFGLAGLFAVYSLRHGGATFSLLLHGSMENLFTAKKMVQYFDCHASTSKTPSLLCHNLTLHLFKNLATDALDSS